MAFKDVVAPIAQIIGIVAVAVGVAAWGFNLQGRVDNIDQRLKALATSSDALLRGLTIQEVCARLTLMVGEMKSKPDEYSVGAISGVENWMKSTGCGNE